MKIWSTVGIAIIAIGMILYFLLTNDINATLQIGVQLTTLIGLVFIAFQARQMVKQNELRTEQLKETERLRKIEIYQYMDKHYNDLLEVGLNLKHPEFFKPETTAKWYDFDEQKKLEYELFAYMWWNICETIYDQQADEEYFKTWKSVIWTAYRLHSKWLLDNHKTFGMFKPEFVSYLEDKENGMCHDPDYKARFLPGSEGLDIPL